MTTNDQKVATLKHSQDGALVAVVAEELRLDRGTAALPNDFLSIPTFSLRTGACQCFSNRRGRRRCSRKKGYCCPLEGLETRY